MTETVTAVARPCQGPVLDRDANRASALALHLDCSRSYVSKLRSRKRAAPCAPMRAASTSMRQVWPTCVFSGARSGNGRALRLMQSSKQMWSHCQEEATERYQSIVISCMLPCARLGRYHYSRAEERIMPSLISDVAGFESRLAGLPVEKHSAREAVLSAGSKTGKLLFLRSGAVEVVKDGVQIARVSAPGSVFGEQAILLDQPHTADVRTLEQSEFYVADAPAMFAGDPTVALYVATILARRLDAANRSLIEVKRQLQADEPRTVIGRTVEKVEELLSGDVSLVYAGYPYDPFAPANSVH
jgi:CRP/FNR family transcriptional regulator, cyclic AMP receptor protein